MAAMAWASPTYADATAVRLVNDAGETVRVIPLTEDLEIRFSENGASFTNSEGSFTAPYADFDHIQFPNEGAGVMEVAADTRKNFQWRISDGLLEINCPEHQGEYHLTVAGTDGKLVVNATSADGIFDLRTLPAGIYAGSINNSNSFKFLKK